MVSTNPVRFEKSNPPPEDPEPDEVEDDYDGSAMLGKGAQYVGKGTVTLKRSGDAKNWDDEAGIEDPPSNWTKIGQGVLKFMPEVGVSGLFLALGSTPAINNAGYWTSGPSGKGWSEHLFPEDFSAQGANDWVDWLVGNGDSADPILVIGLENNGRIYRSVDGVNWVMRFDPFPAQGLHSITWNPQARNGAGAFFATMTLLDGNPENLLTSRDGLFWSPVDPNNLPDGGFSLASDANKNLMIARQSTSQFDPEFKNGGTWMSDDDGHSWKEFADRSGGFVTFLDQKIGPVIDETVLIQTDAIVVSDARADPTTASVSLFINAFNADSANLIRGSTSRGVVLGVFWAIEQFERRADTLNPFYYQIRLDGSGDAFVAFSEPINEWVDFDTTVSWGYLLNSGVDSKSFTGTIRIREKETLVESNSVPVLIECAVVVGVDLSGVEATPAVGTVGFEPHGEAAVSGVESQTRVGQIYPHGGDPP
ncbi:MAG: hypothetical protein GQ577_03880 [Woeseiaceae bacterium]|nr:hypothetical protein [Woeseiaceae bacterium]